MSEKLDDLFNGRFNLLDDNMTNNTNDYFDDPDGDDLIDSLIMGEDEGISMSTKLQNNKKTKKLNEKMKNDLLFETKKNCY